MSLFLHSPVLLALTSALLFALSSHMQGVGLEDGDPRSGVIISIGTSGLVYWLIAPFFVESWYWLTHATLLFACVGIFRPSLSAALSTTGIKLMGPTLNTALTASAPLFAAAFALLILGERLTVPVALGTLAVVAGVTVSALRPQGLARSWPLWAIALPLGAALIRAIGHGVTKIGLAEVPSPSFAVLVSNSVSVVVSLAAFRLQRRRVSGTLVSHLWFASAGITNALSLQCLNTALQMGEMVKVVPIVSAAPVFTLLLAVLVFKREVITWRTVATIALVVPGVILVALR